MKLIVEQLVLVGLLAAATHWIIARSEIARPFWSRLRGFPAKLLACPACSGFWLGLALRAFGVVPVVVACPYKPGAVVAEFLAAGVLATLVTPLFQALLLWGLAYSTMAPLDDDDEAVPEPVPAPNGSDETPPPTAPPT